MDRQGMWQPPTNESTSSIHSHKGQRFVKLHFSGHRKVKKNRKKTDTVHSYFIEILEKASNGKIGLS